VPVQPAVFVWASIIRKTHLLTAIAQNWKSRVFYITADAFTEHVVQAIRQGRMHEFRGLYRDIDVLLVDDVHRLGGRAATQEEFFHTFNTLHTLGKQIVLSSPVAPSKLEEIEPRLISRFEWGVVLSIEPVNAEVLLRKKAAVWNVKLTDELCTFLAEKFPLNPVLALQALVLRAPRNEPLSVVAAQTLLKDLLAKQTENALTPEKVVKHLSTHFGITPEDVTGKSQMREFALPRQIAMYLCRKKLEMPFQAIGKFFGRDHSTVMSSVKQIEKAVEEKQVKVLEAMEHSSK
jgi:chromosomal replication initiator protein